MEIMNVTKRQKIKILEKLKEKGLLEVFQDLQHHNGKDRAKVIRIFLEIVFPNQKFSVRSRKGSQEIVIYWTDGISIIAVARILENNFSYIAYHRFCSEKAFNFLKERVPENSPDESYEMVQLFYRTTFEEVTA